MSLFSKSRSKGHYPNNNHGGDYYKKPHSSGGILGKIFAALTGSRSNSHSNHSNGHYPGKHRRKQSWS